MRSPAKITGDGAWGWLRGECVPSRSASIEAHASGVTGRSGLGVLLPSGVKGRRATAHPIFFFVKRDKKKATVNGMGLCSGDSFQFIDIKD